MKRAVKRQISESASRKLVVAGRGRVIQVPNIRAEILRLSNKERPHVVYLGTATYEAIDAFEAQAKGFEEIGCKVTHLKLTDAADTPSKKELEEIFSSADVVAVSGGNTLFAVTRWRRLKIVPMLQRAMERGAVMCGGSAGAICWFDGGHSDSRDPTTLRHPRADLTPEEKASWKYIRVSGLGFVPGLCCPHHDTTQSNGVARAEDFLEMLKEHSSETGVCIDDQAAISIDGDKWRVLATNSTSKVTIKVCW